MTLYSKATWAARGYESFKTTNIDKKKNSYDITEEEKLGAHERDKGPTPLPQSGYARSAETKLSAALRLVVSPATNVCCITSP